MVQEFVGFQSFLWWITSRFVWLNFFRDFPKIASQIESFIHKLPCQLLFFILILLSRTVSIGVFFFTYLLKKPLGFFLCTYFVRNSIGIIDQLLDEFPSRKSSANSSKPFILNLGRTFFRNYFMILREMVRIFRLNSSCRNIPEQNLGGHVYRKFLVEVSSIVGVWNQFPKKIWITSRGNLYKYPWNLWSKLWVYLPYNGFINSKGRYHGFFFSTWALVSLG